MKLKEYAKLINVLAEKYPDIDVVYSHDDEGNEFQMVNYQPGIGHFTDLNYGRGEFEQKNPINAICIN